ncbi:MAG TPA: hypothetical protein VLW55_00330 [Burkholderiaceae bacterium]|nr:hypothetical protein [Burkholderiaceae bacterium]
MKSMTFVLGALLLAHITLAGCHHSPADETPPARKLLAVPLGPGPAPVVNTTVDAAGATLASSDGNLQLVVPANALASARTITAAPFAPEMEPVPNVVPGTGYAFGPDGLAFEQPARLSIRYDPAKLPAGTDEANLVLAKIRADGVLELAAGIQVDVANRTVSGDIRGFSSWGVITACNGLASAIPNLTVRSATSTTIELAVGPYQNDTASAICSPTEYWIQRAPASVPIPSGTREPTDGEYTYLWPPVDVTKGNPVVLQTYVTTDANLNPGTSYRYRLIRFVWLPTQRIPIAYPPGVAVIGTTSAGAAATPPAPLHFAAAPDYDVQAPYMGTGFGKRIHLNWSPVASGDYYHLERRSPNGQFTALADVFGASDYIDASIDPAISTRYEYRIAAVNVASGTSSAYVSASATMESGPGAASFCFDHNDDNRCDLATDILSFKAEAGKQADIPFRVSAPGIRFVDPTVPPAFVTCDIYFAAFNVGSGISQPVNQEFSASPLHTDPAMFATMLNSASSYALSMKLDIAADAAVGVRFLTLYATGCLGPTVLKQAIALDVRPRGLPNRLKVEVFGGGTVKSAVPGIDCGVDCDEDYAAFTPVNLTAAALPGSMFSGWSGDCHGLSASYQLTMDSDKTCGATFTLQPVTSTNAHVAAGHFFSLARGSNGAVLSWGIDSGEELGNGLGNAGRSVPGPIALISDAIALGGLYGGNGNGFVIRANGEVWGWGNDGFGQLGDGASGTPRGTPVVMTDATGAAIANAAGVASGAGHTIVLLANGNLLAAGVNSSGELGTGAISSPSPRAVPVTGLADVRAIAAGSHFTVALRTDGTVWTWGANNQGQLADPVVANRPVPAQVAGLANIVAIAAGAEFAIALDASGDVWAWGSNVDGELGDASGVPNRAAPGRVAITGASAIAAGQSHAFAIKGGALFAWGRNVNGQLGLGDVQSRTAPVAVSGIANVSEVAGGSSHSLGVDSNGDVWAWGSNAAGELGIGPGPLQVPTPTRVPSLNVH